jgi:ribosomal protein S26
MYFQPSLNLQSFWIDLLVKDLDMINKTSINALYVISDMVVTRLYCVNCEHHN